MIQQRLPQQRLPQQPPQEDLHITHNQQIITTALVVHGVMKQIREPGMVKPSMTPMNGEKPLVKIHMVEEMVGALKTTVPKWMLFIIP